MDAAREQQIRQRVAAASPPPWTSYDETDDASPDCGCWVVDLTDKPDEHGGTVHRLYFGDMENNEGRDLHNADFIAHARQDVPDLLAALDAARAERNTLAAQYARVNGDLCDQIVARERTIDALRERVATLEAPLTKALRVLEWSHYVGAAALITEIRAALATEEAAGV